MVGSRTGAELRRCGLAVAPRFLWVGIELGRANLEGGGLPSSPFRSARGHNSTKASLLCSDSMFLLPAARAPRQSEFILTKMSATMAFWRSRIDSKEKSRCPGVTYWFSKPNGITSSPDNCSVVNQDAYWSQHYSRLLQPSFFFPGTGESPFAVRSFA